MKKGGSQFPDSRPDCDAGQDSNLTSVVSKTAVLFHNIQHQDLISQTFFSAEEKFATSQAMRIAFPAHHSFTSTLFYIATLIRGFYTKHV